jgi:hypothetical protein
MNLESGITNGNFVQLANEIYFHFSQISQHIKLPVSHYPLF